MLSRKKRRVYSPEFKGAATRVRDDPTGPQPVAKGTREFGINE